MPIHLTLLSRCLIAIGLVVAILSPVLAQSPAKPYKVTIVEDKPEIAERVLPADGKVRVAYAYSGGMSYSVNTDGKQLMASPTQTSFMIDGNLHAPTQTGNLQELPDGPGNKKRHGHQAVWQQGDIRVTMVLEAIPGKPSQAKPGVPIQRRLDTLLIKYSIENTGNQAHKVGCRVFIDTLVVDNDGALFASPTTHPKQILDGLQLEGKKVPDFLEVLQRPNLEAPGFKGIFSFKPGNKLEGPGRVALTSYRARNGAGWQVQVQKAGGDSACVLYWEPQEIGPRSKRDVAFAYGQGIACTNEGRVSVDFGGSFEPGKKFTVTAYVDDPIDGQSLTLLLPKGVERLGGKATQAVPLTDDTGSVVMWRCRVLEAGTHPIRIRSSTGVTKTWVVTISPPD